MKFKFGVKYELTRPVIWFAIGCVHIIHALLFDREAVITSLQDGNHKEKSKHYDGNAVDIRIHGLTDEQLGTLYHNLRLKLDPLGFDTVLEHKGEPNEHVHIEYDPKEGEQLFRWSD